MKDPPYCFCWFPTTYKGVNQEFIKNVSPSQDGNALKMVLYFQIPVIYINFHGKFNQFWSTLLKTGLVIKLGDTSNYHYSPQNCHVFILMYRIYGIYFAYERIKILLANSGKILMHHQYIVIILWNKHSTCSCAPC